MRGTSMPVSTRINCFSPPAGKRVGTGTTFTIDLPVSAVATDATAVVEPYSAPLPRRAGGCILVVEDLEPVRLVTKEMLESDGFEVVAAASPVEALALMDTMGDRVDLILTDVMMPEMTGSELANAIRVRRPGLPVLFMSGLPKGLEWSEPGAFLAKPFTRATLLSHVRARLASSASSAA